MFLHIKKGLHARQPLLLRLGFSKPLFSLQPAIAADMNELDATLREHPPHKKAPMTCNRVLLPAHHGNAFLGSELKHANDARLEGIGRSYLKLKDVALRIVEVRV